MHASSPRLLLSLPLSSFCSFCLLNFPAFSTSRRTSRVRARRDPARQVASLLFFPFSDPAHTRAPQKKRKGKKEKKEGGVGGSPPTLQALFASLSDDVTKSFPHRDAKARGINEPSIEPTSLFSHTYRKRKRTRRRTTRNNQQTWFCLTCKL